MLPDIYTQTLVDNRRALLAWSIGTAAVGLMYAAFYPQVGSGGIAETVQNYPEAMREAMRLNDMGSAAGYLGSTVFGLLLPLLMMGFGVTFGARAVAGDEESGYLDLLLAHPVSRTRLALQRFAGLVTGAVAIAALVFLGMLAIRSSADLDTIGIGEFAAQCVNLALLGVAFGALAIGLGAAIGKRGQVLGAAVGVGVLTYVAGNLAGVIGADWLKYFSPFHYYIGGEPLRHGMQWADAGALLSITAVMVVVGFFRFNRRDLRS
ncbi:ABC transporter permease subunit [Nocardia australiensis]|uniref:ABC transporter permease subunit n=1 Tax=Nocardia australiensis TaxID=2887191 RepID=UPI001D145EE5|nr:ABC transporter permease subunit [Nocardia australiensis]